jgi:excisionase family DNA binding protein
VNRPISLQRLAAHLRLPREWLRREALDGRLPCLRVGKRLLFNVAAVEEALAARAAHNREAPHAS